MLFGSDHPWWPVNDGLNLIDRNLSGATASAVLGGNARRLFGVRGGSIPQ